MKLTLIAIPRHITFTYYKMIVLNSKSLLLRGPMFADLLSQEEELMQGIQLYQGVGQQDQGREKEVIEVTQKANFLHWLRFQQERSLPVYEEEYCIGEVGEEEESKGDE